MNLELSRRHFHSRRGTVGAMTRGQVTGGWAWRHHREWLKELVTTTTGERTSRATPVH